jgi:predicted Zn-dependent protease
VSEIYNEKYAFHFKRVEQIGKALKSKFRELSFGLTTCSENRNAYENKEKTIKRKIDKAFEIIKNNNNKEEIESKNEKNRKKKKIESPRKKSRMKFENEIVNLLNKNTSSTKQKHKEKIKIHKERIKMFKKFIDKL